MSKFLPISGFTWMDPKEPDNMNRYTRNCSKSCILEVDFEYRKELKEVHNNCTLDSDEIEIKKRDFLVSFKEVSPRN